MSKWKRLAVTMLTAGLVAATAVAPTANAATVTGWRFGGANVCVLDQTVKLSDGVYRAAVAWSKAADLNLIWRRSCTGYPAARTITVKQYSSTSDWYYGRCGAVSVYTTGGYLKPGIVTRATVSLNLQCRTLELGDRAFLAGHYLGKAIGLAERTPGSPSTVMSSAMYPTSSDYVLVEKIYPW